MRKRNLPLGLGPLLTALLVLSLITGCFGPSEPDQPTQVMGTPSAITTQRPVGLQELRLYGQEPLTLDPAISQDVSSWEYLLHIFSGLVTLNDQLQVEPDLATRWDLSPDGKTYTFTLRQDAKFHDGRAVTASDFKYSFERTCDPKLQSPVAGTYLDDIVGVADKLSGRASDIAGVIVKDDYTLEITIDSPKEYFIAKLTYPTAFVVDKANVESGKDWTRHPNGTGPFKLREWKTDQAIVLERNDAYYGQKPTLQRVSFYLGGGSPMALYEKNELDVAAVGLADIDRVTDQSSPLYRELSVTPMLGITYIGLNTKAKPFDDVKVRQALVQALDRDKIASVLFKGTKVKATGILPPGMPGYNKDLRGLDYDVEGAQQLLDESSYKGVAGLPPITFSVALGVGGLANSFADIYRQTVGIDLAVEQVDQGFYEDLERGNFQLFFLSWVADYPDPQDFLDILFHSSSPGNHTGYSNQTVDKLLEQARVERDDEARIKLYREAERIIVDEAPIIPLYHDVRYTLVKPHVKGLVLTPMGILSLRGVEIGPQAPAGE